MEMLPRAQMTTEQHLEAIDRRLETIDANIDLLISYMRIIAEELGIRARVKHLDVQIDELRSNGNGDAHTRATLPDIPEQGDD